MTGKQTIAVGTKYQEIEKNSEVIEMSDIKEKQSGVVFFAYRLNGGKEKTLGWNAHGYQVYPCLRCGRFHPTERKAEWCCLS